MTGATINAILALTLAVLWAVTRICAYLATYSKGRDAGYVIGHTAGYRKAYAEQELLVDDLQAENEHLNERNEQLSRQQGRAAA